MSWLVFKCFLTLLKLLVFPLAMNLCLPESGCSATKAFHVLFVSNEDKLRLLDRTNTCSRPDSGLYKASIQTFVSLRGIRIEGRGGGAAAVPLAGTSSRFVPVRRCGWFGASQREHSPGSMATSGRGLVRLDESRWHNSNLFQFYPSTSLFHIKEKLCRLHLPWCNVQRICWPFARCSFPSFSRLTSKCDIFCRGHCQISWVRSVRSGFGCFQVLKKNTGFYSNLRVCQNQKKTSPDFAANLKVYY